MQLHTAWHATGLCWERPELSMTVQSVDPAAVVCTTEPNHQVTVQSKAIQTFLLHKKEAKAAFMFHTLVPAPTWKSQDFRQLMHHYSRCRSSWNPYISYKKWLTAEHQGFSFPWTPTNYAGKGYHKRCDLENLKDTFEEVFRRFDAH